MFNWSPMYSLTVCVDVSLHVVQMLTHQFPLAACVCVSHSLACGFGLWVVFMALHDFSFHHSCLTCLSYGILHITLFSFLVEISLL